jgi:hypothetical protein
VNILVTAGPTREPIDPVRFLTNRSSGKMGYELAAAAAAPIYEADGNMLGDGNRSYEWDTQSRLMKIIWGAGSDKTTVNGVIAIGFT